ncbi:hypothetical protein [Agreia sp. COWG]|uniref:hypothetical protein n=1 Tax=Agreia sp. COWG TaxID=2773266 RepID=UPI001928AB98|nr:hypothetical protein [Agreia sp. COWG]CAD6005275.1 putative SecB-like chaperone SmegB [Agreia sp. COWG]
MPAESDPRSVTDIVEFVNLVELDNVIVHEERSRRVLWTDEEKENLEFPFTNNSLGMMVEENTTYRFRFRAVFTDEPAEYAADIEIVYVTQEPVSTEETLRREFASRVAFMAIYPFIRASVYGSATRLGLPAPVMSIIRQGEFELGEVMSEEQVQEAFGDVRSEKANG